MTIQSCSPYNKVFFNSTEEGSIRSAQVIVPLLLKLVGPSRVIDVGCGRGAWLKVFQDNGVPSILGLDGEYVDRDQMLIDPRYFRAIDLTRPWETKESFDLAVCLEVAEHLSPRAGHALVKNLTGLAPVVLFSAAIPGQGGTHHVNEQWPSYWEGIFKKFGFDRLDPIRRHVWQNPDVKSWYQQNVYLYASPEAIASSLLLQREKQLAGSQKLELVSQKVLAPYTSVTGVLGLLPRLIWSGVKRRLGRSSS